MEPPNLVKIADRGDLNIILVPRTRSRHYEYAPLYHPPDRRTCERYGLPLLRYGQWPFGMDTVDVANYLPDDFERRLSTVWAATIWQHLNSAAPWGLAQPIHRRTAHLLLHFAQPAENCCSALRFTNAIAADRLATIHAWNASVWASAPMVVPVTQEARPAPRQPLRQLVDVQ